MMVLSVCEKSSQDRVLVGCNSEHSHVPTALDDNRGIVIVMAVIPWSVTVGRTRGRSILISCRYLGVTTLDSQAMAEAVRHALTPSLL